MLVTCVACSSNNSGGLKDGKYEINADLEGGSGKATVASPIVIEVKDGALAANIIWSSKYYDYMIVDGVKYYPVNEDADSNSHFIIPISDISSELDFIADTTAMSVAHEIEYKLIFDPSSLTMIDAAHDNTDSSASSSDDINLPASTNTDDIAHIRDIVVCEDAKGNIVPLNICDSNGNSLIFDQELKRDYANQFSVVSTKDGYSYIHIVDSEDYLLLPVNKTGEDIIIKEASFAGNEYITNAVELHATVDNIYLVSTQAMDLFAAIDESLSNLAFCSLNRNDWYIDEAIAAIDDGTLRYAGKYSSPDYELLIDSGCNLAIENTMIYHKPEVIKQLNNIGVPVLIERSSYEDHPFGRMEWIKLYGSLVGNIDSACEAYQKEIDKYNRLDCATDGANRLRIAYFYITSNGFVNVRSSGDYISRMIELANGIYVPDIESEGKTLKTENIQLETFYDLAQDADILIYNGSITGELKSIDELIKLSPLFEDFKAVKNNRVYTTSRNMYQESMGGCSFIVDLNTIISNRDATNLSYLKRVE